MLTGPTIAVLASSAVAIVGVIVPSVVQWMMRQSDRQYERMTGREKGQETLRAELWKKREALYLDFLSTAIKTFGPLQPGPVYQEIHDGSVAKKADVGSHQQARFLAYGSEEAVVVTDESIRTMKDYIHALIHQKNIPEEVLYQSHDRAARAFETAVWQLRGEIVTHYLGTADGVSQETVPRLAIPLAADLLEKYRRFHDDSTDEAVLSEEDPPPAAAGPPASAGPRSAAIP